MTRAALPPRGSADDTNRSLAADRKADGARTRQVQDRLTVDYLEGEWCGMQPSQPAESGTRWIFADDGSYVMGKGSSLADGAGIETVLQSVDIVSVDADAFVISQVGTQVLFTRGPCPAG